MACGCDGVNVGDFRHEVIIEESTRTPGSQGGQAVSWADFTTILCAVKELSGGEGFARDNINTNRRIRLTTWYDETIVPDKGRFRIQYRGIIYNLTWSRNVEGKDIFLELYGTEERMRTS